MTRSPSSASTAWAPPTLSTSRCYLSSLLMSAWYTTHTVRPPPQYGLTIITLLTATTGSGQSKYNGGVQTVKTMAADVEALMKDLALDASRTIIVGHSMGGMVACEVAS